MKPIVIRDTYTRQSYQFESNTIDIVADDEGALFTIRTTEDGRMEVSTSGFAKHDGKVLDSGLSVKPKASNLLFLCREEYK